MRRPPSERIADHVRDIPRSGIRDFFDIVSTMHGVVSLGIGEPDFDTPWRIREAAIFALERGATHYSSNLGLLSLREAIAEYVRTAFDVHYDPACEVLVTVGVSEAMDLAVRALLNPGDEVLFHEPCYVSYMPLARFVHATPVPIPLSAEEGFRLSRARLEQAVTPRTRLLVLNYPNNPTGATLDRARVEEIASFARERDLIVLADEIYSELTYEGERCSIASLPGMRERTIFLHGFSKAWAMTGFRMGFACGPAPLIEAMMKVHQYTMLCAPILSQEAAVEALKNPEPDIADMREEYDRRRRYLTASLEDLGFEVPPARGAFYLFPRIPDFGMTSKEFSLRLLEEERVAVVPGTAFGACGEGHVRCAYATRMDGLREAVTRIGRFIENHRGAS
ncbi:MAG: aminotransferase class I/II-fold pyridoxal phosphate-dependent enzyme [Kiritimatiellae bacterium]|nr:aminotransferase class I/II-fold pyridoxal phosphate-dependent enzyme [Kiritimatiellia bacterium]